MKSNKDFPNGFIVWRETFFEIVERVLKNEDCFIIKKQRIDYGRCGLQDLAEEWTDEFERLNKGRNWDGEFFDEINIFIMKKLGK